MADQKFYFICIKFELLFLNPGRGVGEAARSQGVKSGGPWLEEPPLWVVSEGELLQEMPSYARVEK